MAKLSDCWDRPQLCDVKITTHNITVNLPVNTVCSWQYVWHTSERAGGILQSAFGPLARLSLKRPS